MGKICDQFAHGEQQDAMEFVSFVVDGLHEEVNLRKTKPYIENEESFNRNLVDLSLEQWANGLRRDWSVFYFLFYG